MKSKPQQQAAAPIQENPYYLFVPGHVFFCEYVQVPPALPDDELEDFAEVTIGSLSPFPIEQIAWGWYKDPLQPWMLLYSATFESLARSGYRNLDEYRHVFPSFVSTLPLQFEEPTIYFTYDPKTQTLTLHIHPGDQSQVGDPDLDDDDDDDDDFDEDVLDDDDLASLGFGRQKNIKLPVVYSVHVPSPDMDDADDDDDGLDDQDEEEDEKIPDLTDEATPGLASPAYGHIAVVRDSLLDQVPNESDYEVQENWLEFASSHRIQDRVFQFKNNWVELGGPQPGPDTVLDREQLWNTDIRSLEFKANERDRRQKDRRLLLALKFGALFVFGLVGLEVVAVMAEQKAQGMASQVAQNAPLVTTIQQKNDLEQKINNIATNNLMPFEMLQILNNHRPKTLYFTEVEASNGNFMRMRGIADKTTEVNSYEELLNGAEEIVSCEIESLVRRNGILTFIIEVEFLPFQVPELINPDLPDDFDSDGGSDEAAPGNDNPGNPSAPPAPSPLNLPSGAPPALPPGLKPPPPPPGN